VFLSVVDPHIAAQKHSQLQNARILPACIEGRSPLQALTKNVSSKPTTYLCDPPEFSAKLSATAKVGLKAGVNSKGEYTLTNLRNNFTKTYQSK
jgi:hypothetical protein